MKLLKFKTTEIVLRTFPKLLHVPYFHSLFNKVFAQYQLEQCRKEVK